MRGLRAIQVQVAQGWNKGHFLIRNKRKTRFIVHAHGPRKLGRTMTINSQSLSSDTLGDPYLSFWIVFLPYLGPTGHKHQQSERPLPRWLPLPYFQKTYWARSVLNSTKYDKFRCCCCHPLALTDERKRYGRIHLLWQHRGVSILKLACLAHKRHLWQN